MTLSFRHLPYAVPIALGLLAVSPPWPALADDQPVTLDTIINAWKSREQKIKSFDFRWWSKHFESESSDWTPRGPGDVRPQARPDTTFVVMCRFGADVKDGQLRTRLCDRGEQWLPNKGEFIQRTRVEILEHGVERDFFSNSWQGHPSLDTRSTLGLLDHHNIRSRALRLAFRPLTGTLAVFPGQMKLIEDANNDGDGLITLENADAKVWVDPARDFLPVRYTKGERAADHSELEIQYTHDETFGWLPKSWTSTQYDSKGKTYASDAATVLEHSINNALADSDFELDLPPGTHIYDRTSGEEFIVRAGGHRELVSSRTVEPF